MAGFGHTYNGIFIGYVHDFSAHMYQIYNVYGSYGLMDVESWVWQNGELTAKGYNNALPHFQSLHNFPKHVPQLLSKYIKEQASLLGSLYTAAVEPLANGGHGDYGLEDVLVAVGGVFD
ncbi:hypothetical protein FRC12_005742 [Ceratobasidium sp. 428]|nr:hypothetical protein FRC12_005742 [Ceratobasidium sp. 428]